MSKGKPKPIYSIWDNTFTKIGNKHYSQYVNAYRNAGGDVKDVASFTKWLVEVHCKDREITAILNIANNSDTSLETSAKISCRAAKYTAPFMETVG